MVTIEKELKLKGPGPAVSADSKVMVRERVTQTMGDATGKFATIIEKIALADAHGQRRLLELPQ